MLTAFKLIRTDQMFGDSAMYFQAVENIASRGVATSQVSAGINNGFIDVTTPTAQVAKDPLPLFGRPAPLTERNLFRGHAYVILYPIALLVKVFPVKFVLMLLYALSYTGMALSAYFVLRSKAVSIVGAILFCVLIVTHPAWNLGLLAGQFYPDRLFVLVGFIFMILASANADPQKRSISNRIWLAIAAVACASINERAAVVAGIFLLLYVLLYWNKPGLDRYYRLALGAGLFCYGYIALKIVQSTNSEYSAFFPTSLDGWLHLVQQPQFAQLNTLFFLVNAPLLCLAVFQWRAATIAVILMLPNIFGNIGGAEKVGWTTHYPSFSNLWFGQHCSDIRHSWRTLQLREHYDYSV